MKTIYLIGSLRNPEVPNIGSKLREEGYDVFDDWHAGGPNADDEWLRYERSRGRTYEEALNSYNAQHIFEFDKSHLDRSDAAVMVMPAGKSGHLELGYMAGRGKPTFILFPDGEPERWDVMYKFATSVRFSYDDLSTDLNTWLKQ